jgi:hypothetical protein
VCVRERESVCVSGLCVQWRGRVGRGVCFEGGRGGGSADRRARDPESLVTCDERAGRRAGGGGGPRSAAWEESGY